jgi:hypothetical protein
VTSEAPQAWFVMLQDEASAGRIIVPLRPYLKFSRRLDIQLTKLETRVCEAIPQLAKRGRGERAARSGQQGGANAAT